MYERFNKSWFEFWFDIRDYYDIGFDDWFRSWNWAEIGGIITIAVADAFSDALGIHIAEESSKRNNERAIWEATITTFFVKLFVALSFIVPVLLFDLKMALAVSICWGLLLLITFNYFLARSRGDSPIRVIGEHVLIAIVVIILANYVGRMIGIWFG